MSLPGGNQQTPHSEYGHPHAPAAKRGNRFFQPGVVLGTLAVVARVTFLVVHLFSAHRPAPAHRQVEGGLSNQTSGNTFDVEAKASALVGAGPIYLVQVGEKKTPYSVDDLAAWLRSAYALDVHVLPAISLEPAAYDKSRKQYVSQLLDDQLQRNLATLNSNPAATIIGITDADMFSIAKDWGASFTQRDAAHRVAIISADCLSEEFVSVLKAKPGAYEAELENALERILLRAVAILYWHLPLNNDPESVLAPTLDASLPGHALYQSELRPERTQWGMYVGDPCVNFTYKQAKPGAVASLEPATADLVGECDLADEGLHDEQEERFQVKLSYGLLTVRHNDFYQPGAIPIEFERATSDWWKGSSLAFGRSGSHNYDRYLATWDDMRHLSVVSTGSDSEPLVRIPEGIPMLLFNRWVDEDGSGKMAEVRWRPGPQEHFDLTRYTGDVESYLPCDNKTLCYLNGIRNAHGDTLRFERDGDRSLLRLTGPDQHWLAFNYGAGRRIASISDNRGRQVTYRYNDRGYLSGVSYPSGESLEYGYDDPGYLTTFSASAALNAPMRVLLRNEYEQGRLSKQTLADGRVFEYQYKAHVSSEPASVASIKLPDGTILDFAMASEAGSAVRERLKP